MLRISFVLICLVCHVSFAQHVLLNEDEGRSHTSHNPLDFDGFGASIAIDTEFNFVGSNLEMTSGLDLSGGVYAVGAHGGFYVPPNPPNDAPGYVNLYDVQTGTLIKTIYPPVSSNSDGFGQSVYLGSGHLLVRSSGVNDEDEVYIYNLELDSYVGVIGGGPNDDFFRFGDSMMIESNRIIVTTPYDYTMSAHSKQHGSVRVYSMTGALLHTIYPDSDHLDIDDNHLYFGNSIAAHDGVLVVSQRRMPAEYEWPRNVPIPLRKYDVTTGNYLGQLNMPGYPASDSTIFSQAGNRNHGMEMDARYIVYRAIRATGIDTPQEESFYSLVIYDYVSDVRVAELTNTTDPSASPFGFGDYFKLANGLLAVTDYSDQSIAGVYGSAFIYEVATGSLVAQIVPNQTPGAQGVARGLAFDGGNLLLGVDIGFIDDGMGGFTYPGYVHHCSDLDGDGLYNTWELSGVPYELDAGGHAFLDLPDADPFRKDVYVEIDRVTGLPEFDDSAVAMLEAAFDDSPVENPNNFDGTENPRGVEIHVLRDDDDVSYLADWTGSTGCFPVDFKDARDSSFGTDAERAITPVEDRDTLLEAKSLAYRYCLLMGGPGDGTLGCTEGIPGDSFYLSFDEVFFLGDPERQAAVFMHELGHGLGLGHGGGDHINGKVNYPSIMNYTLTVRMPSNSHFWRLDYSRKNAASFPVIEESAIDESLGVMAPTTPAEDGDYSDYQLPFGYDVLGTHSLDPMSTVFRNFGLVPLDGTSVDIGSPTPTDSAERYPFAPAWFMPSGTSSLDGSNGSVVIQDLNFSYPVRLPFPSRPQGMPTSQSPSERHEPHDDWSNIRYQPVSNTSGGSPIQVEILEELTSDTVQWLENNLPVPCWPDLDKDGDLDFFDVSRFNQAHLENTSLGDWNKDGAWNFFDVSAYLDDYNAGCP